MNLSLLINQFIFRHTRKLLEDNKRHLRLHIKEIIDDIDINSMKAFLLQYASEDRSFEMAFKSHFISRIKNHHDESQKYKRLLDELIKPKNAYNKIGPTQKKTISIIYKDFVLQMNDLLSTNDFTEAYHLIKESMDKLAYLQNRYEIRDSSIENSRILFLKGLELILTEELAPGFRKKIETELKELASKSYFIPRQDNLLELLNQQNVLVKEEKQTFIDDLFSKYKSQSDGDNIVKTSLQLSHPFPDLAKKVLMHFSHDKIFTAIKSLIADGKYEFVDFYIDNEKVDFKYNKEILSILKFIEKQESRPLCQQLNQLVHIELNLLDTKLIVEALPEEFLKSHFDDIQDWVNSLPFHLQTEVMCKGNRNKLLIELLDAKNDIEWLKFYDKVLISRNHRKDVKKLYFKIAENYISNHIGIKSRDYLDRIQNHLRSIGEYEIFESLQEFIFSKYDHRISINETD